MEGVRELIASFNGDKAGISKKVVLVFYFRQRLFFRLFFRPINTLVLLPLLSVFNMTRALQRR